MSSTYIVEPPETSGEKKDDTLIIVVNDDGTISVDQETLQNLIMNQSSANVSVVRVGQTDTNIENGDITLTVDPPAFTPTTAVATATTTVMNPTNISTDPNVLVDPFMEMDPEQLERLETALQSEEAKQILGENVTAMLDMLTVEERQMSIRHSVELDHCYTNRLSPSDPKPKDPLPIAHSPTSNEAESLHQLPPSQASPPATLAETPTGMNYKAKPPGKLISGKQVVRSRKPVPLTPTGVNSNSRPIASPMSSVKLPGQTISRSTTGALQPVVAKAHGAVEEEEEEDATSSGESSESEPPSDDDSDFGPRGPRSGVRNMGSIGTGGIRSRGGRKGLTTRGGSMAAARRGNRGANKHMDMEQVRRLDLEMAAAVNAMKSPGKDDRFAGNYSPMRGNKRQIRITPAKKREDTMSMPTTPVEKDEMQHDFEKVPQTTNHVKASLISANMIKGDMILTKPGQGRSNQRVTFVQKQVPMKPNELKTIGIKKDKMLPTRKLVTQSGTKFFTAKDGKLVEVPVSSKSLASGVIAEQTKDNVTVSQPLEPQEQQLQQHQPLQTSDETGIHHQTQQASKSMLTFISQKTKAIETKKEKRRSEGNLEGSIKIEADNMSKAIESSTKTPDSAKKHLRKEHRKSPGFVADALGPALFSTPDIIRRVGTSSESKMLETMTSSGVPTTMPLGSSAQSTEMTISTATASQSDFSSSTVMQQSDTNLLSCLPRRDSITNLPTEETPQMESHLVSAVPVVPDPSRDDSSAALRFQSSENQQKLIGKLPSVTEDLPAPLDAGSIEGEEHLLATLEMEATKHEEELLAEALLLQEELGVDLGDHPALGDTNSSTTADLPPHSGPLLASTIPPQEQQQALPSSEPEIPNVMTTMTSTPTSTSAFGISAARETPVKRSVKEEKEPIRIVRGGRVITLPPIEAPATRSKKLQAKTEVPQTTVEQPKKPAEKFSTQTVQLKARANKDNQRLTMQYGIVRREEEQKDQQDERQEYPGGVQKVRGIQKLPNVDQVFEGDEDDDDDDEEDAENSDSEDDPDRLWCICKRPHNNRFMICCDVCEDWFHGKCVHVSKAMGQQMEEKGIEWVCPNCVKKKNEEAKPKVLPSVAGKQRSREVDVTASESPVAIAKSIPLSRASVSSFGDTSMQTTAEFASVSSSGGSMQCVVCKKEARNSSIYCSDTCILAHAQETLTKDKPGASISPKTVKSAPGEATKAKAGEPRIVVFERKTGKLLTGSDAPTRSNLKTWLKENPTFEAINPNNLSTAVQVKSLLLPGGKAHTPPKTVAGRVIGKQGSTTPVSKKVPAVSSGSPQIVPGVSVKTLTAKPATPVNIAGRSPLAAKQNALRSPVVAVQGTKVAQLPAVGSTTSSPGNATAVASPRQLVSKKQDGKQQPVPQQAPKQPVKASPPKRPEAEPIRVNIRKSLTDLLTTRIRATEDLKLTVEEISELAVNIEHELYKYFKDTGAKYKAKYRSLVFNIKDTKNLTLFRKIADRSLTPDAVVRLSPDEMASQELAEWREKETKHQLEMIKKNELDLMAQAKSIVVKTHKGEQIIENDGAIDHVDPKTPVQDIVTALNSGDSISSTVDDVDKEKEKEQRDRDKERDKTKMIDEKSRRKDKDRGRNEKESRPKGGNRRDRSSSRNRHRRSRERERSKSRERSKERKSSRNKESRREKDRDREKNRDRKERDRSKTRERGRDRSRQKDKDRERERDKIRDKDQQRERERDKYKTTDDNRNRGTIVEAKDTDDRKRDSERRDDLGGSDAPGDSKPIEDRLWRHIEDETTTNTIDGNDSDVSDREPTSTVTIKTPDINEDSERLDRDQENTEKETTSAGSSMMLGHTVATPGVGLGSGSSSGTGSASQTVWRGFVSMVDVAKFFITAQEISGNAKDLMDDLPDTVDVVGRISHETVWDYISKMKRTGSKEILVIRLTAANDEEKIPYITLYSYLNSRSRLGVVGNVSKNIKDFYIMPFSKQSTIPPVLLPLMGPGLEEQRPHLLLGIIVRNRRKRLSAVPQTMPMKLAKKDTDRSYTPPLLAGKDKSTINSHQSSTISDQSHPVVAYHKAVVAAIDSVKEKQSVTQTTLESLNKAHVGMSRSVIDSATISKIVPELSSKLDLTNSPTRTQLDDDGDEPYSPGQMDDEKSVSLDIDMRTGSSTSLGTQAVSTSLQQAIANSDISSGLVSSNKNSSELQRKMDELNRQIEEQKQQIQSISSSFLSESSSTLPGLGLDPVESNDCDEAYSPSDARSFTPPPPSSNISKLAQPLLEKVSNITIPPNLQEILANVKRQESSKVDPYLPLKPSATFLPTNSSSYQNLEKYSSISTPSATNPTTSPISISTGSSCSNLSTSSPTPPLSLGKSVSCNSNKSLAERSPVEKSQARESLVSKEGKSTLSSLSDLDLIRKAEEELAAVAAAAASSPTSVPSGASSTTSTQSLSMSTLLPSARNNVILQSPTRLVNPTSPVTSFTSGFGSNLEQTATHVDTAAISSCTRIAYPDSFKKTFAPEQPKPPGLEDEDFPPFPSTPPNIESANKSMSRQKLVSKSGIIVSVKRKVPEDSTPNVPNKTPRTKSRWGQAPSDAVD